MHEVQKDAVVVVEERNLDYLLIPHILGNAIGFRQGVHATETVICSLSGMDYRNKRRFLCFDGRRYAGHV